MWCCQVSRVLNLLFHTPKTTRSASAATIVASASALLKYYSARCVYTSVTGDLPILVIHVFPHHHSHLTTFVFTHAKK